MMLTQRPHNADVFELRLTKRVHMMLTYCSELYPIVERERERESLENRGRVTRTFT
jgi:hypothetical protein